MSAFGDNPIPVPGARLVDAYWLDSEVHEVADCTWCLQVQEADARARRATARAERSTAAWVVPPGLPPRPAQSGG
jgi:hypothetical protein